jgi:hypothetical protein
MLPVGLVVVGAIVIAVPFLASFVLDAVSLLAPVFNSVAHVSIVDDITQVSPVPISIALLWWSDVASRVPMLAWAVVSVLTPPSVSMFRGRVLNDSYIHHGLEVLNLRIDLFIVFRQQGCQLIDDHPRGQGIVCRRAVDLLSLILDPVEFLTDRL